MGFASSGSEITKVSMLKEDLILVDSMSGVASPDEFTFNDFESSLKMKNLSFQPRGLQKIFFQYNRRQIDKRFK